MGVRAPLKRSEVLFVGLIQGRFRVDMMRYGQYLWQAKRTRIPCKDSHYIIPTMNPISMLNSPLILTIILFRLDLN